MATGILVWLIGCILLAFFANKRNLPAHKRKRTSPNSNSARFARIMRQSGSI